ncbi:hypothetical protein GCM10025779_03990 [Arthrobacter cryoconiti]
MYDLTSIASEEWRTGSLCPGWGVHDVVAHLLDTAKTTRRGFINRMLAAGFGFDHDDAVGVTRERAPDPLETLASFRTTRLRTLTSPAALETRLVEAFVHGKELSGPGAAAFHAVTIREPA